MADSLRGETEARLRGILSKARGSAGTRSEELRKRIGGLVTERERSVAASRQESTVFVSYRRKAEGMALGLVRELSDTPQAKKWSFFIDQLAIPPGAEWERYIREHLATSWVMLLVVTPDWNEDTRLADPGNFVRREIELAREYHVPVIPVLLEGAQLPDREQLPDELRWLAGTEVIETFNQQLRRVMIRNLAAWLSEIRAEIDEAGDEIARADKAAAKLTAAIEDARRDQAKAEQELAIAAAARGPIESEVKEAERRLADCEAKIDPPRPPGRIRIYVDHEPETLVEAQRLRAKLAHALGAGPTVELAPAEGGDRAAIDERLARFDVLMVLIGPSWPSSSTTDGSVAPLLEAAVTRGMMMVPLLVRRVREPTPESLPPALGTLFAHNFLALRDEFWEPATDKLVIELEAHDRVLARREQAVKDERATVKRSERELERVAAELTRAQTVGRSAAERIVALDRQAGQARDEVKRLRELPADRRPAFVKGPPKIRAGAG